jgi:hypothetical protein
MNLLSGNFAYDLGPATPNITYLEGTEPSLSRTIACNILSHLVGTTKAVHELWAFRNHGSVRSSDISELAGNAIARCTNMIST